VEFDAGFSWVDGLFKGLSSPEGVVTGLAIAMTDDGVVSGCVGGDGAECYGEAAVRAGRKFEVFRGWHFYGRFVEVVNRRGL